MALLVPQAMPMLAPMEVRQIGDAAQRGHRDDARSPAAEAQRGIA
jgi:hypothetical protein